MKPDYRSIANKTRRDVLKMVTEKKVGFVGSAFSSADILTVLYHGVLRIDPSNPKKPDRDVFLLSKGHAASLLYAVLSNRGFFPQEVLDDFCCPEGKVGQHTIRECLPGVENSSGSLGHGLGLGCGVAVADKISGSGSRTFVLLGDGECNEGSVWEAVMFAARFHLENLIAIIDRNQLQSYGTDEKVLNLGRLAPKFESFGWRAIDVDGHDYDALEKAFNTAVTPCGKPTAIIAATVKGKDVSYMENGVEWHYKWPSQEQYETGLKELLAL